MRKSRYDEAESGEFKLDACEVFFRYRVHVYLIICFLEFLLFVACLFVDDK